MPAKKKSFFVLAASVAVLLASTSTPVKAQSATWLGSDTTPNIWSDPLNWSTSTTYPGFAGSTSDIATFDSNAQSFTPTISGTDPAPNITVGNITIASSATQAFTFTVTGTAGQPASLTFSAGGIANGSTFTQQFAATGDGTTPTSTFAAASFTFNNGASAGTNTAWTLSNGAAAYFNNTSSAGGSNTTWTINTGSAAYFSGSATSVSATFVNSGTFDISQQSGGVTVGSIAGSGNFYLGSNTLTTGSDNTSTTVSGVIQDSGTAGGSGGILTKIGTGTLTLTGTNTYSGGTNLNNGTLLLDDSAGSGSSSALGTGPLNISSTAGGTTTLGSDIIGQKMPNNVNVLGNFSVYNPSGDFYFTGTVNLNDQTNTVTGLTALGQVHFSGQIFSSPAGGGINFIGGGGAYTAFIYDGTVANTYTGLTTIGNNAFLVLEQTSVINGAVVGNVLVNPGGSLDLLASNQTSPTITVTDNSSGLATTSNTLAGFELQNNSTTIGTLLGNGVVGLGSGTLTVSAGNFTGTIADGNSGNTGGNLVMAGPGTLTLSGSNTYTGTTTVLGGTLLVNGSLGATNTVNVESSGTLSGTGTINSAVTIASGGALTPGPGPGAAAGTLTVGALTLNSGSILNYALSTPGGTNSLTVVNGDLVLAGTLNITQGAGFGFGTYQLIDYTGALTNNNLVVGSTPATGYAYEIDTSTANEVNLDVVSNGQALFWNGSVTTANGAINGGTGTWDNVTTNWTDAAGTVSGTYGGVTGVFEGTAGTVTLGDNITFASLQFLTNGYIVNPDAGSLYALMPATGATITTASGVTATINAPLNGKGSLSTFGPGTLVLTGASDYSGGTTINGGTLSFASGSLGTGMVTFAANSTLQWATGNTQDLSTSNGITINDGINATFDTNGNNVTLATALQNQAGGAGSGSLTKIGLGTLTLDAANTYSGGTSINAGALSFASGALGSGLVTFTGNSTLQWAAGNTQDVSTTNGITIDDGITATFDTNGNDVTFASALQTQAGGVGSGALTKIGLGTLTLEGTNTYSGATTVSGGALQAGASTGFSSASAFTITSPGTLDVNGFTPTIGSLAGTGTVTNNGAAAGTLITGNDNTSTTFSGLLTDGTSTLALTKIGTGTLTLTGTNTYSGGTNLTAGELSFAAGSLGTGPVTFTGNSTLQWAAGNTQDISTVNGITINDGITATLDTNGNDVTLASGLQNEAGGAGSGALTKIGNGILTLGGASTYSGATMVTAGTLQAGSSTGFSSASAFTITTPGILDVNGFAPTIGSLTGTGTVTNNGATAGTLNTGNDNTSTTFSGLLADGTSTLAVTKAGTGTLTLTGTNTYSGGTNLSAGQITFANGALGSGLVTFTGNSTLQWAASNTQDVSTTNGIQISDGITATLDTNGNNITLATALQTGTLGTGALTKIGAGALTLEGTNTYTGATTVNAGSLLVDGSLAAGSAVTVNSGATLGGTGTINGSVTINSGGAITPGSGTGAGTLTVGSLTLNTGSVTNYQLSTPGVLGGGVNSLIIVNGDLNLGGTLEITALPGVGSAIGSYEIMTYTGTLTDDPMTVGSTAPLGYSYVINTSTPGQVDLDVTSNGQTIFWNGSVTTANGTINGGTGTWDNVTTNWTDASGTVTGTYDGTTAIFAGTAGTVTLGDNINFTTLEFTTTGYVINGDAGGAFSLTPSAGATITTGSGVQATINAPIIGTGDLTISGGGTLTLGGVNTYSGATAVTSGTLQAGSSTGFSPNSAFTISSPGILDVNGFSPTVGSLAGNGTVTNNGASPGTLITGNDNTSTTFSGLLTDGTSTLALTKIGTGTLTLTGVNTYSGGTNLNGGEVSFADGSLGTGMVTFTGSSTLQWATGNTQDVSTTNGITINDGVIATIDTNGNDITFASGLQTQVGGVGSGGLTVTGSGMLTLEGTNTYSGPTTVNNGTLQAGSSTGFSPNSAFTVTSPGILDINGFSPTIGSLAGTGTVTNNGAAAGTLTTGNDNTSTTFSGVIQDGVNPLTLTKIGAGTLTLTGTNTYSGGTNLTNGGLLLDDTPASGTTSAIGSGPLTITNVVGGTTLLGSDTNNQMIANYVNIEGDFSISSSSNTSGSPSNIYFSGTVDLNDQTHTITGLTAEGQVNFSGQIVSSPTGIGGINFLGGSSAYTAFIYNGTVANTYTGLTTVGNNAFLVLEQTSVTNGAVIGNILVNQGGSLDFLASNQTATNITVTDNSTGLSDGQSVLAGFELQESSDTIGTLLGNGSVGLGSGTLTLNNGNFSGTISDGNSGFTGGNLVMNGPGLLTLSGTSSYTGTTTILGGTIQAGSNTGFSPNSAFTLSTGAVIDVNGFNPTIGSLTGSGIVTNNSTTLGTLITGFDGTSTTFTGTLQDGAGPLGLLKTGAGTFTIYNSTYSGPTTVLEGTLQAATTTAFSARSDYTISFPGVLDLNGFNSRIGSLGGTGTVTNMGTTPVVLTTGLDNADSNFGGTIQDGNSTIALVKAGTGAMILSSPNTFSGGTTLQSGSLLIASGLALGMGNVTVTGGTLGAAGGTLDIQVGGNYKQTGGELDLRIGGFKTGSYDRLAVVGSASLGGTLNISSTNGYIPTRGTNLPIVIAGGGVTGQFQLVTGDLANMQLEGLKLEYTPDEVILQFGGTNFEGISDLTPNELAVATALDNLTLNVQSNKLLDYLASLPAKSLPAAFDRIAPEEYGTIYQISVSSAKMVASSVENRLDAVHATHAPFGAGGPAGSTGPFDANGATSGAPSSNQPGSGIGVFANASGEFVSIGDSLNAAGYTFDSGGVTFGADTRMSESFVVGALFNYTGTQAELVDNGRLNANGFRGGIYSSLFGGGAYVNGFLGGGYNEYDLQRTGLDATVRGNSSGGEFNALVQTGYDAHAGGFTYGPVASLQYTYTGLSSLQEQGSLDPLNINSGEEQSTRTNIGVRASYDWHIGSYILSPQVRATWQHEFGDVIDSTTASMVFGSPNFTVTSSPIGRDSLLLNVGFTLTITPQIAGYIFYDGELGRMNYQDNNLLFGLRIDY